MAHYWQQAALEVRHWALARFEKEPSESDPAEDESGEAGDAADAGDDQADDK